MDKKETEKLFRLARSVYRKAEEFADSSENSDTLLAWSIALEPYSYDEVREAFFRWVRSSPFAPKISELVRSLGKGQGAADSAVSSAGRQWQDAIDRGECFDAAETLGAVSRYARENDVSMDAALADEPGEVHNAARRM